MPITVRCPQCSQELVAPDELVGKIAACPHCNLSFPLTVSSRSTAPPTAIPLGPPLNASAANPPLGKSIATASIPSNLPPTQIAAASAVPPAPPEIRGSNSAITPLAKSTKQEARGIETVPPVAAALAPKTQRTANPAKFVTANPTERRINLGADGRLPELILQEGIKTETVSTGARTSNPLILVAVLTVSFGLSALMLFTETGTRRSESQRQAQARDELALHYTQSYRRLEPYQEELRRALQFHNQGKYAEERKCYRRVLDLLHEEHRDNLKGLTGVRHGASPPSDEHLESLLSRLLSEA